MFSTCCSSLQMVHTQVLVYEYSCNCYYKIFFLLGLYDIVTIERSVKKLIPSCQNCQPENTYNACKQIITFGFAVKTHLKINAQKRYLHQNQSFGPLSFIGRRISSFRRFVWPQFIVIHRMISPTKWKVQRCPPSWDWPGFALRMRTAKSGSGGHVKSQSNVLRL